MRDEQTQSRPPRFWPLAAGLVLLIAAARIAATLYVMREVPNYDQWAAIDGIALPLAAKTFDLRYLFAPHNEHLIVWTKLLDWLQLVAADDQYDQRPVGILLALLSAIGAAWLLAGGTRHLKKGRVAWLCAGLGLAMIPYSWESLSVTWNNSFVFLILGAAGTLWLAAKGTSTRAPLMLIAAIVSALAMGSGWIAPVIGIGAIAFRAIRKDLSVSGAAALGLPLAAVVAFALALTIGKAHSGDSRTVNFASVFAQIAVLTAAFVPTGIILARAVARASDAMDAATNADWRSDLFVATLSAWGYLHVLSMIVLRADFHLWMPISRYMDVISVAIMANLACLLRVTELGFGWSWSRIAVPVVAAFAAVTMLAAPLPLYYLHWQADRLARAEALIATVVRDHDSAALARANPLILPFPDRAYLEQRLSDENVRRILGDRVGSRTEPANFVRASRRIEQAITDHGIVLSVLVAVIASVFLAMAAGKPRLRPKPLREAG